MKIKVRNLKNYTVQRGGQTFSPLRTTELEVTKYSYQQIKACNNLKIEQVFGEGVAPTEPAAETQKGKETFIETKAQEPAQEPEKKQSEKLETDLEQETDEKIPETEIAEEKKSEEDDFEEPEYKNNCPYCENYGGEDKSTNGLNTHVRMMHEERYEEFRRR